MSACQLTCVGNSIHEPSLLMLNAATVYTANKIHDLLSLEAEHGPLPGYTAAVEEVLAYLMKVS